MYYTVPEQHGYVHCTIGHPVAVRYLRRMLTAVINPDQSKKIYIVPNMFIHIVYYYIV